VAVRVTRRAPPPPRRSTGPMPGVLALGGAVLAATVCAFLIPPADTLESRAALLDQREAAARRLERDGRLEEAAGALEGLARDVAGQDAFRVRALEWRAQAKALRAEAQARRALEVRWRALQARAGEAADLPSLMSCRQALAELRTAVGRAACPWSAALETLMADVDRRIEALKVPSWQEIKNRLERELALGKPGEAQWNRALERWAAYLKEKLPDSDREGAKNQIQGIHLAAKGEADRIRKRADALAEAGRPDEGRALLEAARPRFAGTAGEEALSRKP